MTGAKRDPGTSANFRYTTSTDITRLATQPRVASSGRRWGIPCASALSSAACAPGRDLEMWSALAGSSEPHPRPSGVTLLSDAPLSATGRDFFGFDVYAEAIASLIDNEVTDTPITIAITAPWGGGKTSVAEQVRRRLAERSTSRGQQRPVRACWFNAWMHNDAQHLGASLAAVVARTANSHRPLWRRLLSPIPSAMLTPEERWRRRLMLIVFAIVLAAVVVLVDVSASVAVFMRRARASRAAG